jgi:tRNA dimethylallyltransferase
VGKSEAALLVAEQLGGEIISVDSMQVYRGMDIGTAKPSASDRSRIPHHLLDIVDITEPFDAAQFVNLATQAVLDIHKRGRTPIFCGGTGLYFKAFLEGLGDAPPAEPRLRAELESMPLSDLLQELAQRDPITYERIDRRNSRRVIRAVEVIRLTGKPFAPQRAHWAGSTDTFVSGTSQNSPGTQLIGLTRSSGELRSRIDARVEQMFRLGLVAETERLLQNGLARNRTALQALGYRQVHEHLLGARSLLETIELLKIRTRQFAKRQMTWFRRQLRVDWLLLQPNDTAEHTAGWVLKTFSCP